MTIGWHISTEQSVGYPWPESLKTTEVPSFCVIDLTQNRTKDTNMEENAETTVVSDNCDECGQTIWYDPDDESSVYCDDEDLAVEHECDPDEWEDED